MRQAAPLHGTTILAVRHGGKIALAGDGQSDPGPDRGQAQCEEDPAPPQRTGARGLRRLDSGRHGALPPVRGPSRGVPGQPAARCGRARQGMAHDRSLRRLEAFLVVADRETTFLLSGAGDVITPDDGIVAVAAEDRWRSPPPAPSSGTRRSTPRGRPRGDEAGGRDLRSTRTTRSRWRPSRDDDRLCTRREERRSLDTLSPREIVAELDRWVVGQAAAKRAVAIALAAVSVAAAFPRRSPPTSLQEHPHDRPHRGREDRDRAAARPARGRAPSSRWRRSKFTEVGYVGRDVDAIVRDLVAAAFDMVRREKQAEVREKAELRVEERLLDVLLPTARPTPGVEAPRPPSPSTPPASACGPSCARGGSTTASRWTSRSGPCPPSRSWATRVAKTWTSRIRTCFRASSARARNGGACLFPRRARCSGRRRSPASWTRTRWHARPSSGRSQRHRVPRRAGQGRRAGGRPRPTISREGVQSDMLPDRRGHDRLHEVRAGAHTTTSCSSPPGRST